MPKVSIVLPSFNGERYIEESIDSVLKQTFIDWELIIVDDCSTDNTLQIAKRYAAADERIHVLHNEENQQLPASLNIGFAHSRGEFLTWTSDDNYYFSEAIETMWKYLLVNEKVQMVCAGMKMIDADGRDLGEAEPYEAERMYYNDYVGACFMYRRNVLNQIGDYDTKMFLVEDYDYWLRVLEYYGEIGYIRNVLYTYRKHENSLTGRRLKEVRKQLAVLRRKNLDWILQNLKDSKSYVCRMYYDFLEAEDEVADIEEKMMEIVPELKMDISMKKLNSKVIIFGAGNYGEKAAKYLGNNAVCFADSNESKAGGYKCGLSIISVNEMLHMSSEYMIFVAVGCEKILEMLQCLYGHGIKECYTYQKYVWNREKAGF